VCRASVGRTSPVRVGIAELLRASVKLMIVYEGHAVPEWPQLLGLYSRFRAGITVLQWMQDNNVLDLGIDVRRFASFGVIKAILRIFLREFGN